MRKWIDLFENDDDDHMAIVYERERRVKEAIKAACAKARIDIDPQIAYDEEFGRLATIKIEDTVSLDQLNAIKHLGSKFVISANPNGAGVYLEFVVSDTDSSPKISL